MVEESHIYDPETLISEYTNKPINDDEKTFPVFWCEICQLRLKSAHMTIQHLGGRLHRGRMAAKNNPAKQNNQNDALKRKHDVDSGRVIPSGPVVQEPAAKKKKEQAAKPVVPEENIKCDDCDIEFGARSSMAIQHFKGKKHAAKIAAKLALKQIKIATNRWQGRGVTQQTQIQMGGQSGRDQSAGMVSGAGRGRGRGDGFQREHGFAGDGVRFGGGGGHYGNSLTAPNILGTDFRNSGKSLVNINSIKHDQSAQKYIYGKPSNNFLNTPGDNFRNNSPGNMQQNQPRNDLGGVRRDDFYGNSSSSNFGTPQYELKDHLSKEYFTSNVGSQKDTFSSRPLKDMYNTNIGTSSNGFYDRPALLNTPNDNYRGGNYYSKDYGTNNNSNSNNGYRNSGSTSSPSFVNKISNNGYEMNKGNRYDSLYSGNY